MATAAIADTEQSGDQEPEDEAEVISTAATDGTAQLRSVSGDGARELLASRYSAEQDEQFVAGMRAQYGL